MRRFGAFLLELTLVMVMAIFAFNLIFHRHLLDSALFSLALAVGLTPQLLPAIISINLARGAAGMAKAHVIVKRLASIENFGCMDVLCSDKTGTLTQGKVSIHSTLDVRGRPSERVLRFACLNASFESGFANPIDEALRRAGACERTAYKKLDELPYDFVRKRLSVLVAGEGRTLLDHQGGVPARAGRLQRRPGGGRRRPAAGGTAPRGGAPVCRAERPGPARPGGSGAGAVRPAGP